MELPDGRPLMLDNGVLTESASGDGRLVLWLPAPSERIPALGSRGHGGWRDGDLKRRHRFRGRRLDPGEAAGRD